MKTSIQVQFLRGAGRLMAGARLAAVLALGPAAGASAQQVLVPPPVIPEAAPPPPAVTATNLVDSEGNTVPPELAPRPSEPFQFGPVTLRPHVAYQFVYGNGIQSGPGSEQKTVVQEIAPGIRMQLGPRWTLDYTPVFTIYSDANFEDTVNHFIDLAGLTSYYDWTFQFSQKCALTSEPQVETASQIDRQIYTTLLNAVYQMNTEMSLEFGLNQEIQTLDGFTNSVGGSQDWTTMDWFNIQWGPNLSAAAGVGLGYEGVDVGSDMTYEQFLGRINWKVAQKVNLSVNGGVEIRQFLDSSVSDAVNPIMGLLLEYRPFEATTLRLNADRTVSASYFEDQIVVNARFSGTISQRLLKKLYLGVSGGYGTTDYSASGTGASGDRKDDYSFLGVSLSANLFKRGMASLFYSTSRNSSSQNGFSFTSQQMGFQLAYRY